MNQEIYNLIKNDIQEKFGRKISYAKDCESLSDRISEETSRQISSSTLKRFFGLVSSPFKPSKYTLETLIRFLGFNDFPEYINQFDNSKFYSKNLDAWDVLKSRINVITQHSLKSMNYKSAYDPRKFIFRSFIREKFEKFMAAPQTATLFVAPDGYGKTTALLQLAERYFGGVDSENSNDIIFVIDGGIFFNLFRKISNFELMRDLLEFRIQSNPGFFFRKNPEKRKGRMILFIDDVDEIFYDSQKYHELLENMMRMLMSNDSEWFKMVLTCRPENLSVFSYMVRKNPVLKNIWYDIEFEEENLLEATNVPVFNQNEIKAILSKRSVNLQKFEHLRERHKNVMKIIQYPYFLHLLVEQFNLTQNISEITLLSNFIKTKLNAPPYREEKTSLVDSFLEITEKGRTSNSVKKELLLPDSGDKISAYNELLSYGIFYEYTVPKGLIGSDTYVRFTQNLIFEYLIIDKWCSNRALNVELFEVLKEFYQNNPVLKCNLLKLFVQLIIHKTKNGTSFQLKKLIENLPDFTDEKVCYNSVLAVLDENLQLSNQN